MKHILSLSLGSSRNSSSEIIRFGDGQVRITSLGVDFDTDLFESILKSYDGECDAICVNYLPPRMNIRKKSIQHDLFGRIEAIVTETPVFFGHNLRSIYMDWSVRKGIEMGHFNCSNANLLFFNALTMIDLAKSLESMALSVRYLDPWTYLRLPIAFKKFEELEKYTVMMAKKLETTKLREQSRDSLKDKIFASWFAKQIKESDIIVVPTRILENFDLKLFKGKTLLLDTITPVLEKNLREAGVQNAFFPRPILEGTDQALSYSIMEALIAFSRGQDNALSQEDIVEYFNDAEFDANLHQLDETAAEIPRKYAFIIHPLSQRDLFRHPLLKPLMKLPAPMRRQFEHHVAMGPGFLYGNITGVRSESNGVYADGLVYSLFATPREMMEAKPEVIYQKLLAIGDDAKSRGAKIMGLGAFTKIVGDGGVTVAARACLPVTTGNSLSAAATLWAAKDACRKMGFLKPLGDSKIRVDGTVMIIGATGSIGKACTSVISASFSTIVIAAINVPRLMAYKAELQAMYPECKIHITTQPERFADQCDLIVVSTSATEGGAFNLDNVKPGCVICDVSRPLTFSAEDSMKRPDVLVIESGEIELPGDNVKVSCDLGLEHSTVYACLAETALLALEGRYESFTLSRNINYRKVKEIYKIARKHGARLAQIRSPNGIITDQEIQFCRQYALIAIEKGKQNVR